MIVPNTSFVKCTINDFENMYASFFIWQHKKQQAHGALEKETPSYNTPGIQGIAGRIEKIVVQNPEIAELDLVATISETHLVNCSTFTYCLARR